MTPVPQEQDECIGECIQDLSQVPELISEECAACISAHVNQCSTLEFDCEPICEIDEDDPPPPPPPLIDAGFPVD